MSTFSILVFTYSSLLLLDQAFAQVPFDMIYAIRQNVSRLRVQTPILQTVLSHSRNRNVVGLDIDLRQGLIIYSDVKSKRLIKGTYTRTAILNEEIIASNITNPDGVAVDWINHKIYLTTAGSVSTNSTVQVMDLQTRQRKTLFTRNDGTQARGIVVDPLRGWLFVSDYNETTAKIFRMSMDGSQYKVLFSQPFITFPNGLAYNYRTQTLYWIDAGQDIIGSIKADGPQVKTEVNLAAFFSSPHAFNLAYFQGNFYFTDWKCDCVRAIYSPGTSDTSGATLISHSRDPTTLRILDLDQQPERPGGNPCSGSSMKCTEGSLCLLSSTSPRGYSCVCPDGINPSLCRYKVECPSDRCLNGGTCSVSADGVTLSCTCSAGFTGDRCSIKEKCSVPNHPQNGAVSISIDSFSETAKYSCDRSFNLVGNLIRVCIDQQWSGSEPRCEAEMYGCSLLPSPPNGEVKISISGRSITARYICNPKYKIKGNFIRVCKNSVWNGKDPKCVEGEDIALQSQQNVLSLSFLFFMIFN